MYLFQKICFACRVEDIRDVQIGINAEAILSHSGRRGSLGRVPRLYPWGAGFGRGRFICMLWTKEKKKEEEEAKFSVKQGCSAEVRVRVET